VVKKPSSLLVFLKRLSASPVGGVEHRNDRHVFEDAVDLLGGALLEAVVLLLLLPRKPTGRERERKKERDKKKKKKKTPRSGGKSDSSVFRIEDTSKARPSTASGIFDAQPMKQKMHKKFLVVVHTQKVPVEEEVLSKVVESLAQLYCLYRLARCRVLVLSLLLFGIPLSKLAQLGEQHVPRIHKLVREDVVRDLR
jgi:hypothetical protein